MPRQARLDARAREGLAYLALEICGYTASAVADLLGVRLSAVYRAAQRGRTARGRWERVLTNGETERNIRKQCPVRLMAHGTVSSALFRRVAT